MPEGSRFRLLVAGGGVAALEGMLALRELVGSRIDLELVSSAREFMLRATAVGEPFGYAALDPLPLIEVAADLGAHYWRDALVGVDADRQVAIMESGAERPYDALLIAIGAVPGVALPGAVTYGGPPDNARIGSLLSEMEEQPPDRLVFAVPPSVQWALPMYELALLTARRLTASAGARTHVALVTHESSPLDVFGPSASDAVRELLDEASIELVAGAHAATVGQDGLLLRDGRMVDADRVVASPRLTVPSLAGIPQIQDGFIPTDDEMRVDDLECVYAAGDATWFPIKQGGIAAQQADVAASSVAALIDPNREPIDFRPTLRAALITGGAPQYLRAVIGEEGSSATATGAPLWWPPAKVAGRHLAPYLMRRSGRPGSLEDLGPLDALDQGSAEADNREALELALTGADADAVSEDYRGALRWLEAAQDLTLVLPTSYAAKRRRWAIVAGREPRA